MQGLLFLIPALCAFALVALFHLFRAARRRKARHNQIHNIVAALHAEICMGYIASSEHLRKRNIRRLRSEKRPFFIVHSHDGIFNALKPELSRLPASIMHRVLHYYRRAAERAELLKALLRKDYQQQSEEMRSQFTETIIDTLRLERRASIDALRAMEGYARGQSRHLSARRHDLEYAWLSQMRSGGKTPPKSALMRLLGRRRTFEHAQLDTLLEQWDSLSGARVNGVAPLIDEPADAMDGVETIQPTMQIEGQDSGLRH